MSYENSAAALFRKTALHVLTRPVNLALYWLSWHYLCALCRYGQPGRNLPVLAACLLWWLGAIGYGLWLWGRYKKGRCPVVFRRLLVREKGLVLAGTAQREEAGDAAGDAEPTKTVKGDGTRKALGESAVKWYVKRRRFCQFFLEGKEVVLLDLSGFTGEERDFLDVKLSAARPLGKGFWRAAAGIFLAAVTLQGGWMAVQSAIPYRGKLAWYLDDLKNKRTCTLEHDNIYEYGIEGILEDVRQKVDLPEELCLVNGFGLEFGPDGRILALDAMFRGFDGEGNFVDSYLIGYNRAQSGKLTIYLHGAAEAPYDESRALGPLAEAMEVMPLRETVEEWEGEQSFGILYYGVRDWYSPEGIRLLSGDGDWQLPRYGEYSFSGYSISVFCPENDNLTPVRYIWTERAWP